MNTILAIGGSDPSGGAGIQADLRTIQLHGFHGAAAVTAITVQDTVRVTRVEAVAADLLEQQIRIVVDDLAPSAVKIGLLPTVAAVQAVRAALQAYRGPVVIDTPLLSTSGHALVDPAVPAALADLADIAALYTPNAAEQLRLPKLAAPVLVTGGDQPGDIIRDVLYLDGATIEITGVRIPGSPVRGTGCALATSIACHLGRGDSLPEAIHAATKFVRARIAASQALGRGSRIWIA